MHFKLKDTFLTVASTIAPTVTLALSKPKPFSVASSNAVPMLICLLSIFLMASCQHAPLRTVKQKALYGGIFDPLSKNQLGPMALKQESNVMSVVSLRGDIWIKDIRTGKTLFHKKSKRKPVFHMLLPDKRLLLIDESGKVEIGSYPDGQSIAQFQEAHFFPVDSIQGSGSNLLMRNAQDRYILWDFQSKATRWTYEPNTSISNRPGFAQKENMFYDAASKLFYVGLPGGRLVSLDADTGLERVVYESADNTAFDGRFMVQPVDAQFLWLSMYRGETVLYDLKSRSVVWQEASSGSFSDFTRLGSDEALVGLSGGRVRRVAFPSGKTIWEAKIPVAGLDIISVKPLAEYVLVFGSDKRLRVLSMEKGEVLWTYIFKSGFRKEPIFLPQSADQFWVLNDSGLLSRFSIRK